MSQHNGFQFRIRRAKSGWRWTTYDARTGEALVDGSASTRAEAAAHVIRSIAERAGTGEEREPPRTAEERAQSA